MKKLMIAVAALSLSLFSCGQEKVVYKPLTPAQTARLLAAQGIDPCRVLPCSFSGKEVVEVIKVPAQDRGDFIIYPHKEAVVVKPIDALPPDEKVLEGRCRR